MRDLADELLQAKVKAKLFGGDHAPRLGRLVILDRIGAGAMGTVYAAYDPRLDRKVAVKVMHAADEGANARVLRECRALAKLAHPNIVTIHDAGDDTGAVHVVMELATGVPLRAWIDNKDRTWRDVVRVMAEVAAGLAAAHRAGIVHRDIKPDNILVGDRARLIDFGLALAQPTPARGDTIGPSAATAPRKRPNQFETVPAPAEALAPTAPLRVPSSLDTTVPAPEVAAPTPDSDDATVPAPELAATAPQRFPSEIAADGGAVGPLAPTGPRKRPTETALAATDAASIPDRVAGTPSYMAPELLAGGDPTPASDQFSFAVTLFEALYGERPYTGTTRAELREAALHAADGIKTRRSTGSRTRATASDPDRARRSTDATRANRSATDDRTALSAGGPSSFTRTAPAVANVPAWVEALIKRALAANPDDRFRSLDDLHAELTRDRRRRRVLIATVATALVAGGAIGALAYRAGGPPPPPPELVSCDGHARLETAWSDKRIASVRSELGDVPWASATLDALGRAGRDWEASFKTVCEATRVRGDQSDRLLELRTRCLDRALARFGVLVDALASSLDGAARVEAPSSIAQLPAPARCETLTDDAELALPADPAKRAEVTAVESELDHAWVAYALGRYRAARTQATSLSTRASKLDAPALHASILLLGASIEGRTGDGSHARTLLEAAAVLAARAKAPELELAVWTRMLRQELFAGHFEQVLAWAATGTAAAARVGRDGGEVEAVIGEAARLAGRLADARTHLEAALATTDPLREDARALIEMNLASIDLALGKSQVAEPLYQRSLERARRALGDGHPTLAIHIDRLAEAARARGKLQAALAFHEQSTALRQRAFGPDDRSLATARFHRAETLLEAGRLDEAVTEATAARAIRVETFGKRSERLGEIDLLLGDIALARGNLAGARSLYDRATELGHDPAIEHRLTALVLGATGPLDRAQLIAAATALLPADQLAPKRLARDAAILEPFTIDRACTIAVELVLLPPDQAAPLRAALLARYTKAGVVDAGLSIAIGDALLAAGDRATAATAYDAAVTALADEPSRLRLHAERGRAAAIR